MKVRLMIVIKANIAGLKKEGHGSIAVEAAFVMPVVLLVIFSLIYLAFYLHDYNRIQGAVDLVIHKASIASKHDADIESGQINYEEINERGILYHLDMVLPNMEKEITGDLEQEFSKGLLITDIINIEVKESKVKLQISVTGKARISLHFFLRNALSKLLYINLDKTYPLHNPAETIRTCELILSTASEIKGADKLKEVLKHYSMKVSSD